MPKKMRTERPGSGTSCADIAPLRRRVAGGQLDVWLARIPATDESAILRRCRAILAPRELASCVVFHHENDRRRALVARALVRETLSRYAPVEPEAWAFATGKHGKPEISAPAGSRLRFNISHAGNLVACAVTIDNEVGVDLEDRAREIETLSIARRIFSPEEIAAFEMLAPDARQRRFFEHWTLKEAYLKARGLGFALAPSSASFGFGSRGRIRARFAAAAMDDCRDWWFGLLRTQPGYVLALASRLSGQTIRIRTFLATPGGAAVRRIAPRLYAESLHPARTSEPFAPCTPIIQGTKTRNVHLAGAVQ